MTAASTVAVDCQQVYSDSVNNLPLSLSLKEDEDAGKRLKSSLKCESNMLSRAAIQQVKDVHLNAMEAQHRFAYRLRQRLDRLVNATHAGQEKCVYCTRGLRAERWKHSASSLVCQTVAPKPSLRLSLSQSLKPGVVGAMCSYVLLEVSQ